MTDNEIIKALECCKELICKDCPIFPNSTPVLLCKSRLEKEALDLIKRQQAEIEGQKRELRACIREVSRNREIVRNQAITEFAERLKDMHKNNKTSVVSLVTVFNNINRLVDEMTEADNGAK